MSNGYTGCGSAFAVFETPDQQTSKGEIDVSQSWSSSANFVELTCRPHDGRTFSIYLDADSADAEQLAVALLNAVNAEEMAAELRRKSTRLVEQEVVRQRAEDVLQGVHKDAEAALLAATAEQRAAYDAAMTKAESQYEEATGEPISYSRSLHWGERRMPTF